MSRLCVCIPLKSLSIVHINTVKFPLRFLACNRSPFFPGLLGCLCHLSDQVYPYGCKRATGCMFVCASICVVTILLVTISTKLSHLLQKFHELHQFLTLLFLLNHPRTAKRTSLTSVYDAYILLFFFGHLCLTHRFSRISSGSLLSVGSSGTLGVSKCYLLLACSNTGRNM